jgi:hypothetical protein
MKDAYIDLIEFALKDNCKISVWDGGEWQIKKSILLNEIVDAVKSVEEAKLRFYDSNDSVLGCALVSPYGLEPNETVIDYSESDLLMKWENQFEFEEINNG